MLIRRTSDWILGTAMAAAVAHFTQLTELSRVAQTFADAFEPDLDAWEYIPVALATAEQAA
ncbi:thiazole synthase [Mycobacterium neglectum]|jgi:hypothetical protein|uniref:thiazole synthase n=1 Tax=Mycobacterium neglectum TaxID=242737 RepID=UPI000BFEEFF6|nr:thiazole synthase [Mycobacterium neglectum]